jgi:hypothetical protein
MAWQSKHGFGEPFIDVDEWRDSPRRHRYVHGGFENTHTRFSFYLPPGDLYQGRFFQFLEGGTGGSEHMLAMGELTPNITGSWVFDLVFDELGGYLLESNQGHLGDEGNMGLIGDVERFGASAESALFSKVVAAEMYGSSPHHGYVWGASGGGFRTLGCIENAPEVYDGASPQLTSSYGGAHSWSAAAYWWLYCRDKKPDIVDATMPGGSGDPFATLTTDEREALATLYRRGWPRGAESLLGPFFFWSVGIRIAKESDPSYFDDFWNTLGYLGHDDPARLDPILVDRTFTVTRAISRERDEQYFIVPLSTTAVERTPDMPPVMEYGLGRSDTYAIAVDGELGDPDKNHLAKVTLLTGKAKGLECYVMAQAGSNVLIGLGMTHPDLFEGVEPGDEIRLDNRELIAWGHLWRYAVDLDMWTVTDPVTGQRTLPTELGGLDAVMVDGLPIYPQREIMQTMSELTGKFARKVIQVQAAEDTMVMPAWVPAYERLVRANLADQTDDLYRLW